MKITALQAGLLLAGAGLIGILATYAINHEQKK